MQLPVAKGVIQDHGVQNEEQHARGGDGSLFLGFVSSPAGVVWCASDLTGRVLRGPARLHRHGGPSRESIAAGEDARSANGTSTMLDGAGFCEWARTGMHSLTRVQTGDVRAALTMVRAVQRNFGSDLSIGPLRRRIGCNPAMRVPILA